MRAQSDTELTSFAGWTLRVREASVKPPRLLLLIHGWTGDENSMWVFVGRFSRDYWMVAPRAPQPTRPNGYSWREAPGTPGAPPTLESLRPAAASLVELADSYGEAHAIDVRQFDAIGFSQGAAVVNTVALLYPDRVGRVGVLAGFVPAGAEPLIADRPLRGKTLFVAHGTQDERVKVEDARHSIRLLEQAGAQVTYCEDEVGHKVSAACLRALEAFFV